MVGKLLLEAEYFHLSNGDSLKSIDDLAVFLKTADLSIFSYHVNGEKNDFYNWVKYALDLPDLAEKIESVSSASLMASEVEYYINSFNAPKSVSTKPSLDLAADDDGNFGSFSGLLSDDYSKSGSILSGDISSSLDSDATEKESNSLVPYSVVEATVEPETPIEKPTLKTKSRSISKPKKSKKTVSKSLKDISLASLDLSELDSPKPSKDDLKTDAKSGLDYSFDFNGEKDTLAKIKERISLMDQELQFSGSPTSFKALSKSAAKLDSDYPTLDHKNISSADLKSKKKSPVHHVKHAVKGLHGHMKNAAGNAARKVKHMHRGVKEKIVDSKKQNEIKKYLSKVDLDSSCVAGKKPDFEIVDETMETRAAAKAASGMISAESQRKGSFLKSLFSKFKKSEKKVAKALPNLHEFAHERRAEERIGPYENIEHKKNYHIHGLPDFIRGLLIGLVIGMLFIVVF